MPQPDALVPPAQRPARHRPRTPRCLTNRKEANLTISISAVLLLGALVYLLWRFANLSAWQAAICVLFGYFLATSSIGPTLGRWPLILFRVIGRWHL